MGPDGAIVTGTDLLIGGGVIELPQAGGPRRGLLLPGLQDVQVVEGGRSVTEGGHP
jgi:hypothetical protein